LIGVICVFGNDFWLLLDASGEILSQVPIGGELSPIGVLVIETALSLFANLSVLFVNFLGGKTSLAPF
jgi:hypothetical protein